MRALAASSDGPDAGVEQSVIEIRPLIASQAGDWAHVVMAMLRTMAEFNDVAGGPSFLRARAFRHSRTIAIVVLSGVEQDRYSGDRQLLKSRDKGEHPSLEPQV